MWERCGGILGNGTAIGGSRKKCSIINFLYDVAQNNDVAD